MQISVLPLGALVFLLFCTSKRGWGWKSFLAEADTGKGVKYPRWAYGYLKYVLPVLIVIVLISGYLPIVQTWIGLS